MELTSVQGISWEPSPPVRIAIVGCGLATDELHLPAVLACRELEVSALVDADLGRARLLARKYGCRCRVTRTLEDEVLDHAEGVLVVTPNHTHASITRAALERRRPVLVEKPFTVTFKEALELCDLAKRVGCFVSVGFVTRYYPVVGLFKRLLEDGFFGRPAHFHFEYGTKGGWAPRSGYTLSKSQSGGGVLVTNGTHFLDRMLFWFGYPKHFKYCDDSMGGPEANCKAWLEFENGLTGTVFFSKTIALKNRFVMSAERYTIELPYSEVNNLTLKIPATPDVTLTIEGDRKSTAPEAFRLQVEDFARAIRTGSAVMVPGEVGALSVKLCEEFYSKREQLEEPWAWYTERTHA